jgi:hypothetical protein
LLIIALLLAAQVLGFFSGEPGGLAGCAVNGAGQPAAGNAQVAKY